MLAESIAVTLLVVNALDTLGVPYAIGGSLASAVHGVMREQPWTPTWLPTCVWNVEPLAEILAADFYADTHMMRTAISAWLI